MTALAASVSDTLVLAKRNLLRIPRQPDLLLAFTIQPVMFVLLFVYVFGGAISSALAWNEKPMIRPVTIRTPIDSAFVATSLSVRPASTAARAIGSERKRSMSPLRRSSERPIAVTNPPNAIVWAMIPGIRKSA